MDQIRSYIGGLEELDVPGGGIVELDLRFLLEPCASPEPSIIKPCHLLSR